jgi:peptidoglycan/LPS O-acetylase OafA/YrhL
MCKRLLRLYPLLFYTVIVFFIFQVTTNLVWPQLLNHTQTLSSLIIQTADSLLFTNSTRLITSGPGMNYPSWSISAEMISYFTFGIIMFVSPKHKNFVFAFIFLLAAILLYTLGNYRQTSAWGFLRGITCFITGCYAFLLYSKNQYKNISKYWEPAIILFLAGVFYLFQFITSFKEQLTLLTIPATFGTAVYIFSLGRGRLSTWLCSYPLQWLGKISYSVYLNHAIVLIIVWKLVFVVAKIPVTDFTLSLMLIFYISVVLIYSQITYTIIEKKFKHHLNSKL